MTVQPLLDLGKQVLYGSSDGGKTVYCEKHVDKQMKKVAEALHLARHRVRDKNLYCAGDIECRIKKNSKNTYLLDMARAMPPESPTRAMHLEAWDAYTTKKGKKMTRSGEVFYRLVRPEWLQLLHKKFKVDPLSADALTNWGQVLKGSQKQKAAAKKHNTNAHTSTDILVRVWIPFIAKEIANMKDFKESECSKVLHARGINIRHIGLLHSKLPPDNRSSPPLRHTWRQSICICRLN